MERKQEMQRWKISTAWLTTALAILVASTSVVPAEAAPRPNRWTSTGSMAIPRRSHSATLLQDGRVLVVGGAPGPVAQGSAEIYDPATNTWAGAANMQRLRGTAHLAVLLPDGRVLVAGGRVDPAITAEIFNPADGTWTLTADMTESRSGASGVLLPNGKVLVAGGQGLDDFYLNSAELYDPATGTWTPTGAMNFDHASRFTMHLLHDGTVLVAGGLGDFPRITNAAELYDPATGAWSTLPPDHLQEGRESHASSLLANGKVLVSGGTLATAGSAELYDPATKGWSLTGRMTTAKTKPPSTRSNHTSTRLASGKVLVTGGCCDPVFGFTSTAEIYNPAGGTWSKTASMAQDREFHTATLLPNGRVLVVGGRNTAGAALASAELYRP